MGELAVKVISFIFTIYFPGFVCFVLYLDKISGERLQDHWSSGFIIPPQTVFVGGYTLFTLSVRRNDRPCVRNVLFPVYLEESLIE